MCEKKARSRKKYHKAVGVGRKKEERVCTVLKVCKIGNI